MSMATPSRRAARLVLPCALALAAVFTLDPSPTRAADNQWIVQGGEWQTPGNWSLGHVPSTSENVLITSSASANYIPSTQPPASYVSPALGGFLIDVPNSPSNFASFMMWWGYRLDVAGMTVGQSGKGEVLLYNGVLNAGNLDLGGAASGNGVFILEGPSILTAGRLSIGTQGQGTFTQAGGQANLSTRLSVGGSGNGVYNLAGGTMTAPTVAVADNVNSSGILNFTGGALSATTTNGMAIGFFGTAQVNHSGGTLSGSNVILASHPGSYAGYKLSGAGVVSSVKTTVGRNGVANFEQRGGSHIASGSIALAEFLGSSAVYQLYGGLVSTPYIALYPNSTLQQIGGTLRTGTVFFQGGEYVWSGGALEITSDLPVPDHWALGGTSTLSPDHVLKVQGLTTLNVPLTIDGGSFSTGNLAASGAGALHFRRGNLSVIGPAPAAIIGAGQALGQTLAIPAASSVNLATGATVQFESIVSIDGGRFDTAAAQNHGLIHVATPTSRFVASSLTNHPSGRLVVAGDASAATLNNAGEVLLVGDSAAVRSNRFSNSGILRGRGTVFASFINAASGEVQAEAGQKLRFLPSVETLMPTENSGRLSLLGGTLEFDTVALNNTGSGIISGRGTLSANLLENAGAIHLSAGLSDIFAPLNNIRDGSIIVTGNATATFHGPVTIEERTTFQVSTGATAVFLAPVNNSGLVTGGGAKHFESPETKMGALSTSGSSIVEPTGAITATHIREASLTVSGQAGIMPNGTELGTSRLGSLAINDGGTFDLSNNDLVIDSGDLSQITGYLSSGKLTSSSATAITTLGVILNGSRFTTFSGQTVSPDDVLVKFTYYGDTNFDGRVSIADFLAADRGFARNLSGWANGDFNHSGGIDATDYFLIDQAFLGQSGILSGASPATPVPEPSTLLLLLATSLGLRRVHGRQM